MYGRFVKRMLDIVLSFLTLVLLSPLMLILTIVGAIMMHGNPFFVQKRPGRRKKIKLADGTEGYGKEKIFSLIKFRSMTLKKDKKTGELLPDEERMTKWGTIIRKTSVDELPELFCVLKGDMSIIGPRPLLVSYLDAYTETERNRHNVRPGLTGLAQVNGRNSVNWDERLAYDVEYVRNLSFANDLKILFKTVSVVLRHTGVAEDTNRTEGNLAEIRGVKNVK